MKLLYLGTDRAAAETVGRALREAAPGAMSAWTRSSQGVLRWCQENPDAGALIVGPDVPATDTGAVLGEVRAVRPTIPVIIVVAETAELQRAVTLAAGADGYVVAGPSLRSELHRVLTVALDREQSHRASLAKKLADLEAARSEVALRLERSEAARRQEQQRSAAELAAAEARLSALVADHHATEAREARLCTALQQGLLEAEDAVRRADEHRASEAVAFADTLTRRHAEFTASLTHAVESRDALAAQLAAATAALDEAQQAHRAEAAAAADRFRMKDAEAAAAMADAVAERITLENALAEAEAAHRDDCQRLEADLAAANERQAALEDLLGQETDRRAMLEREFAASRASHEETETRQATDLTKALARLADVQARYDAERDEHAAEAQRARTREAELVERLGAESGARAAAERDLTTTRTELAGGRLRLLSVISAYRRRGHEQKLRFDVSEYQVQRLRGALDDARQAYETIRTTSDAEIRRVSAEYGTLRVAFEQLQAAFQSLEHIAGEHAAEHARLSSVVADRDLQIAAQAERHRIADHAAQDALARVQRGFDASAAEAARLSAELDRVRVNLEVTRTRAETLRVVAERVPGLEAALEESQKETRRHFERAPYALCRCTAGGVITDANHAFVALVGRRRADDVKNVAFTTAVTDCAGDLGWLLDRMRARKSESVETEWKTRDGRSLTVRLHALATASGSVDIVVEDITGVRALEERLRYGQRMEAVGRLASEVAATCDALLRDVLRDFRESLSADAGADALRAQAEGLVLDLTRTARFLRQLGAFAAEQETALATAHAGRVVDDLAPVLQRVLGESIELVVPKTAGDVDVDLDAERLARILVNVAGYARARIPYGGQLTIDVAPTVVGRRVLEKHPGARPGPHVLITATAVPAPARDADRHGPPPERPGVELAPLADLIAACGGFMWMEARPEGDMLLTIHLPRRTAHAPDAAGVRSDRGGRLSRWFRNASASVLGS